MTYNKTVLVYFINKNQTKKMEMNLGRGRGWIIQKRLSKNVLLLQISMIMSRRRIWVLPSSMVACSRLLKTHIFGTPCSNYLCCESSVTVRALEGPLLGVRSHVDLEAGGAAEHLKCRHDASPKNFQKFIFFKDFKKKTRFL